MNIIDKIISNIDENKIKNLPQELHEIALVKMIYIESTKYFYRDELFFLFKENLKLRNEIYNREIDYKNIYKGNITCNTYCKILCHLFNIYRIKSKKIDYDFKRYIHTKIIINNKYIIDPLLDLINVKMSTKLESFCKKEEEYIGLTEEQNKMINKAINYDEDKYQKVTNTVSSLEELLDSLQYIDCTGGIVDLKMILNKALKDTKMDYKTMDFFIDIENIKNRPLLEYLNNDSQRKRGIIIETHDSVYIVSLNFKYKRLTKSEWNFLVKNNKIKENKHIGIKCIKDLKEQNIDEETIHNRWVLQLLKNFETKLAQKNEELINYIKCINGNLLIEYNCSIYIYIENNELHLYDRVKNNEFIITSLENKTEIKKLTKKPKKVEK